MPGQIERAELYIVRLPLISPFAASYGEVTHRESLILRLVSGGVSGWGECSAFRDPFYSYETIDTALHIAVTYLIPLVLRSGLIPVEELMDGFDSIRGHHMSRAMVENALLDLHSRKKEVPLYEWIGGSNRRICSGISIGMAGDTGRLLAEIEEAVRQKYHRVKVKIKKGRDLEVLSEVRASFPELKLAVDANGSYSSDDIELLKRMDRYDLEMIEQPFGEDNYKDHSLLQGEIRTPVCLDETIRNFQTAVTAVAMKSCRIICLKQGRLGGIMNTAKILEYCRENGIKTWAGGMLDTGIGRAFSLHLQGLDGFDLPGDISGTSRYFAEDIVAEPVVPDKEGYIDIPPGNGTGVNVVMDRVEKFMIYRKIMKV